MEPYAGSDPCSTGAPEPRMTGDKLCWALLLYQVPQGSRGLDSTARDGTGHSVA